MNLQTIDLPQAPCNRGPHISGKRAFDVVLGTALALVAAPIVVVLALVMAALLRAWPFFVQERIGLHGRPFRLPKIRTLPKNTPAYASKYDLDPSRIPRLGGVLRRTHLDELPQLFLVPTGRLSLVGPRPKMPEAVEPMDARYAEMRTRVRQGCTGLWQIGAHTDRQVAESPAYDLFYVRHACLRLDIWIVWRTAIGFFGAPGIRLDQVPRWARGDKCAEPGTSPDEIDLTTPEVVTALDPSPIHPAAAAHRRVWVVIGTRPDGIKMAPVYEALRARPGLEVAVVTSGQHAGQLAQSLRPFGLSVGHRLDLLRRRGESLAAHAGRMIRRLSRFLEAESPDYVLVHGDTTTCAAAAWASFLLGIPVGHVESGLRSHDLGSPFPEEANRRLADQVADLLLPPTEWAKRNLLSEGFSAARMVVTGQTGVDAALRWAPAPRPRRERDVVAVTLHRRENWPRLPEISDALASVAAEFSGYRFVLPLHANPEVRSRISRSLDRVPNFDVIDSLGYEEMLALLARSALIVTDSGGLQEEGLTLGVPVVVVRDTTERPEALEAGGALLAGSSASDVRSALELVLGSPEWMDAMARAPSPFGDGAASERVADAVLWRLGLGTRPVDWEGPRLSGSASPRTALEVGSA